MSKKVAPNSQLGQTLIETLVAIFILITALITATSVAYYSFKNIDNSRAQIIGTALAREEIEAVKNVRDSNWQHGTLSACDTEVAPGQKCYKTWLTGAGQPHITAGDFAVDFDPTSNGWVFNPISPNSNPAPYQLNLNNGSYSTASGGVQSGFYRKINISFNSVAPYTSASPQVILTATSWWSSRSCPLSGGDDASLMNLPASCKIVLVMHLTNWKNY